MRNNRSRQASPILISLGAQLFSIFQQSDYKPPITIFLIIINVFVHIAPYPYVLGFDLSNIGQNCIQPNKIIYALLNRREVLANRIVLSSIIHADDVHLYYNMLSLCWKGINLEKDMGSGPFLKLVVYSLLCSHTLLVILAFLLDRLAFASNISGFHSCAVGFSAVLFSLKYVWNSQSPGSSTYVGGIQVPTRYAAWLELALISLMTPNASFLGHLAGILAGVLYVKFLRRRSFMQ
jgi:rhomboid domain-containing protein 1